MVPEFILINVAADMWVFHSITLLCVCKTSEKRKNRKFLEEIYGKKPLQEVILKEYSNNFQCQFKKRKSYGVKSQLCFHYPYKELIQHHIKRQSTSKLQQVVLGESSLLPEELQPMVMDYIDQTNSQLGYSHVFWANASCRHAFEEIMEIAINFLPIQNRIPTIESAYKVENQELAFKLFQIPTISFAYSASTQRGQRKFMGIRKGMFG